jgi:hypothetical protein
VRVPFADANHKEALFVGIGADEEPKEAPLIRPEHAVDPPSLCDGCDGPIHEAELEICEVSLNLQSSDDVFRPFRLPVPY